MIRHAVWLTMLVMFAGCDGDGSTAAPCDPVVDDERCSGSAIRQICSEDSLTWTWLEGCGNNEACSYVSGVDQTRCALENPRPCEAPTTLRDYDSVDDDECENGFCMRWGGFRGMCVPDHCIDGLQNGDELHIDCGGSCLCADGMPCESDGDCRSTWCQNASGDGEILICGT